MKPQELISKMPTVMKNQIKKRSWVNFTNILHEPFSYESFVRSFFVLAVKVKLFIGARILAQLRQYNVGEIDSLLAPYHLQNKMTFGSERNVKS